MSMSAASGRRLNAGFKDRLARTYSVRLFAAASGIQDLRFLANGNSRAVTTDQLAPLQVASREVGIWDFGLARSVYTMAHFE